MLLGIHLEQQLLEQAERAAAADRQKDFARPHPQSSRPTKPQRSAPRPGREDNHRAGFLLRRANRQASPRPVADPLAGRRANLEAHAHPATHLRGYSPGAEPALAQSPMPITAGHGSAEGGGDGMDSKAIEALARRGITLVRWETGRQYVGCPRCAQQAKHAHNRRARKLAVSIEPDGAVLWFCNNCEWSGGLNDHSRARQEAPRARPRPDLVLGARRSQPARGDRVSLPRAEWATAQHQDQARQGGHAVGYRRQTADAVEPVLPRGRPRT